MPTRPSAAVRPQHTISQTHHQELTRFGTATIDVVNTTLKKWLASPFADDPAWNAITVGTRVTAVRLLM